MTIKWKVMTNHIINDIKNHAFYHFNDMIRFEDFGFDNILIDKKSYKRYFGL